MRIWYQSAATLSGAAPYEELLKQHISEMCRPDTVVDLHGMPADAHVSRNTKDHIGYLWSQTVNVQLFMRAAIEAEEQGYDAFFVGTIPDFGFEEIRTLVDIPVVGYGNASLAFASGIATKVGVVNFAPEIDPLIRRNAEHYRLDALLGPFVEIDSPLDATVRAYADPTDLIAAFRKAASRAVELGAEAIIPGPGPLNLLMAHHKVSEVDGVPVIDSVGVGLKMCEVRADFHRATGLRPCRRGFYFDRPREELVKNGLAVVRH